MLHIANQQPRPVCARGTTHPRGTFLRVIRYLLPAIPSPPRDLPLLHPGANPKPRPRAVFVQQRDTISKANKIERQTLFVISSQEPPLIEKTKAASESVIISTEYSDRILCSLFVSLGGSSSFCCPDRSMIQEEARQRTRGRGWFLCSRPRKQNKHIFCSFRLNYTAHVTTFHMASSGGLVVIVPVNENSISWDGTRSFPNRKLNLFS